MPAANLKLQSLQVSSESVAGGILNIPTTAQLGEIKNGHGKTIPGMQRSTVRVSLVFSCSIQQPS